MKEKIGGTRDYTWSVKLNDDGYFILIVKHREKKGDIFTEGYKDQDEAVGWARYHAKTSQFYADAGPIHFADHVIKWLIESGHIQLADELSKIIPSTEDYEKKKHELVHQCVPQSYFQKLIESELFFHNRWVDDMKKIHGKRWEPNEHAKKQHADRMRELTP